MCVSVSYCVQDEDSIRENLKLEVTVLHSEQQQKTNLQVCYFTSDRKWECELRSIMLLTIIMPIKTVLKGTHWIHVAATTATTFSTPITL